MTVLNRSGSGLVADVENEGGQRVGDGGAFHPQDAVTVVQHLAVYAQFGLEL